ncbi:MAG: hypothetical protein JWN53_1730 [Gemmatimonadetes bacterium]|nr:hypothetical protein [Gemmatimonadota bacterium]
MIIRADSVARSVFLLLVAALAACQDNSGDAGNGSVTSAQDSMATTNEVRSSIAGEVAPGAQDYSYRGLYAGITRSHLEQRTLRPAAGDAQPCQASLKQPEELTCVYQAVLGPDSAQVRIEALYGAENAAKERVAREVTVIRELPIDVDGVRLARELSDAFDRQTALLDRRDASYGHHQAHVQMGTVSGSHKNYVEMTVMPHTGREELTVKMTRGGPPPAPPRAAPPTASPPRTTKVRS